MIPVGKWTGRRPDDEVKAIKRAVRRGEPFAEFWIETASKWSSSKVDGAAHMPKKERRDRSQVSPQQYEREALRERLHTLYGYYAMRERGDARFVNATEADPAQYSLAHRFVAFECASQGRVFSFFWSTHASTWSIPMYRLKNWYRGLQKRWRDVTALQPPLSDGDRRVMVAALASMRSGDGAKPMQDGEA